jgi:hypothetical protein
MDTGYCVARAKANTPENLRFSSDYGAIGVPERHSG